MNNAEMINEVEKIIGGLKYSLKKEKLLIRDLFLDYSNMTVEEEHEAQCFEDIGTRVMMINDYVRKSGKMLDKAGTILEELKKEEEKETCTC